MTVRFSALAPINDPASLYKPIRKVIHRAHPEIRVARGNHALIDSPFAPLRGWFPVEVFHFPLRSPEQCAHKAELQGNAFENIARAPTAYHANMFEALKSGTIHDYYEAEVVGDLEVARGVETGRLVHDSRLRDALRQLEEGAGHSRSRCRRSSTTPRMQSRPPCSARRMSCASSAGWTLSRNACSRSSSARRACTESFHGRPSMPLGVGGKTS